MNRKLTKRELSEPNPDDKRYVRRIAKRQLGAGQFAESDDHNRSLSADDRREAKPCQRDRGDERRTPRKRR